MMRKLGIVKVSYGVIEQALHFPEGHRIVGIRLVDDFSDTFEIAIEGPTLPDVSEGEVLPRVQYMITVTEESALVRKRVFVGKIS